MHAPTLEGLKQRWRRARAVESPAFARAALQSEVRRAWGVLFVGLILLIYIAAFESANLHYRLRITAAAGVAILVALQVPLLVFARRRQRDARAPGLPLWLVTLSTVIEALVPNLMVTTNIVKGVIDPYAALASPPMFASAIFLVLSTLRLRPALCIVSGSVVTVGFLAVLAYVRFGLGAVPPPSALPAVGYVSIALMAFVAGLAAAWVARELRAHVEVALAEAEVRRQRDRLEHDLSIARSLQEALRPQGTPSVPGFEVAGWNRPADATGGDYYDWQPLPDGSWMLTIADVSGHGIGPALVTAACRAYMRASSAFHADLGSLTTRVNNLLAQDLPDGRFVTLASAVIRPQDGTVSLLSAGHAPIVLLQRASGEIRDILPHDVPLAVLPDTQYAPPPSIVMQPGDVLALVTDGYVEWPRTAPAASHADRQPAEQFGLERLRAALHRHAHLPANQLIQAITAEVEAFAQGSPQRDDLTMVLLRRTG